MTEKREENSKKTNLLLKGMLKQIQRLLAVIHASQAALNVGPNYPQLHFA